jgi:hypothetical protein
MGWTERRWPVGDLCRRGRLERAVDGKEWSSLGMKTELRTLESALLIYIFSTNPLGPI